MNTHSSAGSVMRACEVCVRLHVSLQTLEFLCPSDTWTPSHEHQQPAARQHMSDFTHRSCCCCCVESEHVNESESLHHVSAASSSWIQMFTSVSVSPSSALVTPDALCWSSAGRVSACTIHPQRSSASLSADRDVCLFSLGEFHLELLQPSRSDNPTPLNSHRCWKCYGDVTSATLSHWRQDFYEESTLTLLQTRDCEIKLTSHLCNFDRMKLWVRTNLHHHRDWRNKMSLKDKTCSRSFTSNCSGDIVALWEQFVCSVREKINVSEFVLSSLYFKCYLCEFELFLPDYITLLF